MSDSKMDSKSGSAVSPSSSKVQPKTASSDESSAPSKAAPKNGKDANNEEKSSKSKGSKSCEKPSESGKQKSKSKKTSYDAEFDEDSSLTDSCSMNEDHRDFALWEFLNEQGIWKPYDPLICKLIESQRRKVAVVKLREVDVKMCNIVIDFKAMQQIRQDTGSMRPVRRTLYPYDHVTLSQNVMWDWRCESGTWSRYDVDTCAYIEVGKLQKKKSVDLYKSSYLPYVINLNSMVQIKKDTGFQRQVRRIVLTNHFPRDGEYDTPADDANEPKPNEDLENTLVESGFEESKETELTDQELKQIAVVDAEDSTEAQCCSAEITIASNDENETEAASESTTFDVSDQPGTSRVSNNDALDGTQQASTSAVIPVASLANVNSSDGSQPKFSSQFEYIQHVFMAPTNASHLITRAFAYFTALMLAPIVPVLPRTPPIPIYIPPLSSRRNTRKVEGVKKPCSPHKARQYSQQLDIVLKKFSRKCKKPPEDDCAICMMPLNEFSSFVVNENFSGDVSGAMDGSHTYQLKECHHIFHKTCVEELYKNGNRDGSLQCPTCKHVYGVLCGNQPPGSMHFYVIPFSLPGFPDCETIQIIYNIGGGIQGLEHPNPGKDYTARGFPRKCYLPNNDEGRKVLKLLVIAWERRLIFTIGRSATSGEENTVIWNDIHHKTEFGSNTTGHGFPDPFYFSNVLSELHAKNITERLLDDNSTRAPSLTNAPANALQELSTVSSPSHDEPVSSSWAQGGAPDSVPLAVGGSTQ